MNDTKRLALGVVTATIVLGFGVGKEYGVAWGVAVAIGAVLLVAGVAALGDQLGRRRAGGH